jgi:ketosteroid isomerase-like protein
MGTKLPDPLNAYYAAVNGRDIERALALFLPTAVVKDEAEEHDGRAAIRSWMQGTAKKYGPLYVEPTALAAKGDTLIVTSTVSGDFKGSPATLHYTFALAREHIARLEIA